MVGARNKEKILRGPDSTVFSRQESGGGRLIWLNFQNCSIKCSRVCVVCVLVNPPNWGNPLYVEEISPRGGGLVVPAHASQHKAIAFVRAKKEIVHNYDSQHHSFPFFH